jgi:hypothetical protein
LFPIIPHFLDGLPPSFQPGAGTGIEFYLTPRWDKLSKINVWKEAATQILFSLSVSFGSQLVLASYNKFRNNTLRNSIIIASCNSFTEIYAGFIVFAIVGFINYNTGTPIENVRKWIYRSSMFATNDASRADNWYVTGSSNAGILIQEGGVLHSILDTC